MMEKLFLHSDLAGKTRLLWENGKLISDRSDGEHRITLYKLFSFYVEVYCDLDFTTIEDVRLVRSSGQLLAYDLNNELYFVEQDF
jgi:hypothetical protein